MKGAARNAISGTPFASRDETNERTFNLRPKEWPGPVVRKPPASFGLDPFFVHRLPQSTQSELLVDLRRHSRLHAGRADRDRGRARDALYAGDDARLFLRRTHHARCELRMAAPLCPRERRFDVLHCGLYPYVSRPVLWVLQGA